MPSQRALLARSGGFQPLEKCKAGSHPDISSIVKNDEVRLPFSATAWTAFLTLLSEAIGDHGFLISSRPQAGALHALCCCCPYCSQFTWAGLAFASWVLLCGASKTQCNALVMFRSPNRNKLNFPFRLSLYVNNLPGMKSRSNRDNPPGASSGVCPFPAPPTPATFPRSSPGHANPAEHNIRFTPSLVPHSRQLLLHHENIASASYL
jgi:hypothetical protein